MGIVIADEFASRGANVILICGPSTLQHKNESITRVNIVSAQDMFLAVDKLRDTFDVAVMAAAVADYTPAEIFIEKVKKKEGDLKVKLKRTTDIIKSLGDSKKPHQVLIGFAMETQNEIENAKKKVIVKNAVNTTA